MKIGIIQGRLSAPTDNQIQEFPVDWQCEFDVLESLGLNHIEWIITENSFKNNPIFHVDCGEYKISSLCADNLVNTNFTDSSFLEDNLTPICRAAQKNKIQFVTIPLLEKSDITGPSERKKFITLITDYADQYPDLGFSFEAETHWNNILELVSLRENFWITYDTGNITSQRLNHEDYILNTHHKITNVHLKDRYFEGTTVTPTTGDTDFDSIFNILKKVKYDGLYTIQTARGLSGQEFLTIKEHKKIFERIKNAHDHY